MPHPAKRSRAGRLIVSVLLTAALQLAVGAPIGAEESTAAEPQYAHGTLSVPAASAEEPVLADLSAKQADRYLLDGALVWSRQKSCVSCHTNGTYLAFRPALTDQLGQPEAEIRDFFVSQLEEMEQTEAGKLKLGVGPTQIAYITLGLAAWDRHVVGEIAPETERALRLMFQVQAEDGSFSNAECWPPLESSAYHGATIAAMAAAEAPGWLEGLGDGPAKQGVQRLKSYLQETEPPHDYGRVLLLWTAARMPDLLSTAAKEELMEVIWSHQREDAGWALRTFALPEAWGGGNRAEKLRAEVDFEDPSSDGHMTGLAVKVLRDAGVATDHPRLRRAVEWLRNNQRESGRWWTRSLNADTYHFITYSGTCYALLGLASCDALDP